jgi:hypothetical protein
MARFHQIMGSPAPWGDYGDILRHGLATDIEENGTLQAIELERTGPFVPPITFPLGAVIVTDGFRRELDIARFSGLDFVPVRLAKVVRIDWPSWDSDAPNPGQYPAGGEPENYILRRRHAPNLATQMPTLWGWRVPQTPGLQVQGSDTFYAAEHPGTDVAREWFITWVSERMKTWLEHVAPEWVSFLPVDPV